MDDRIVYVTPEQLEDRLLRQRDEAKRLLDRWVNGSVPHPYSSEHRQLQRETIAFLARREPDFVDLSHALHDGEER